MDGALTARECFAAAKRFSEDFGLDFAFLPFGSDAAGQVFQSKVEIPGDTFNNSYNLAVRPRRDDACRFTSFGIRVSVNDQTFRVPLHEIPAYNYLLQFDTIRFEAGDGAVFVFNTDRFITVIEHDYRENVYAGPLRGAQLVTAKGWLAWGLCSDSRGRSVRVTCEGDVIADIRSYPALKDALKTTGRVQISDSWLLANPLLR